VPFDKKWLEQCTSQKPLFIYFSSFFVLGKTKKKPFQFWNKEGINIVNLKEQKQSWFFPSSHESNVNWLNNLSADLRRKKIQLKKLILQAGRQNVLDDVENEMKMFNAFFIFDHQSQPQ